MRLLSNLAHVFQHSGPESARETPVVVTEQEALIAEWREQVQGVIALTKNPHANPTAITALMFDVFKSGHRIERQLGAFPDTLNSEKAELIDAIASLWGECKMLMVDLLLISEHPDAEIMRLRLRTMARLGEHLDCLDRLHGHETYTNERPISSADLERKYAEWREAYGSEPEAA